MKECLVKTLTQTAKLSRPHARNELLDFLAQVTGFNAQAAGGFQHLRGDLTGFAGGHGNRTDPA